MAAFLVDFFAAFLAGAFLADFLAADFFVAIDPHFRRGPSVRREGKIKHVVRSSWNYELDGFATLEIACPGPKVSRQIELKTRPKPVMTKSNGASWATRS